MKRRTKRFILFGALGLVALVGLGVTWLWYVENYVHRHCIKQMGLAFRIYSSEHQGQLPFSINGFGNALLLLMGTNADHDLMGGFVGPLCGPGDDGHLYLQALTNHSLLPEENCTRVYIQGLSETNDPQICILFDKNSCPGGDHGRFPWRHRLREVCLLDGSMEVVPDERWPEFSREQVELLVAAGFSRTNALHFYPEGK